MTRGSLVALPRPEQRPTLNVWPETGQILGLSRQATYNAVERGEIPTIRVGRRILVPTASLRRMLGLDVAELDTAAGGAP